MVEGSLMGGYEQGLQVAVRLIEEIAARTSMRQPGLLELMIVGRISEELRNQWDRQLNLSGSSSHLRLNWRGLQPQNLIPAIDRSAHLLYSSDIHPACPNSVIEALACGLPVLSFDTGALPEIVTGDSGRIVPYGGDAWHLETPDIAGLAQAALELVENPARFRAAARQRAEAAFGLDQMVEAYLEFILTG
jgi:glycosyltransferase involved in cell wall biosynthesis